MAVNSNYERQKGYEVISRIKWEDYRTLPTFSLVSMFSDNDIVITKRVPGEYIQLHKDGTSCTISHTCEEMPTESYDKRIKSTDPHILEFMEYDEVLIGTIGVEQLFSSRWIPFDRMFKLYAITDRKHVMSWDETVACCNLVGLEHDEVVYRGKFNEEIIREKIKTLSDTEHLIIRNAESFNCDDFWENVVEISG